MKVFNHTKVRLAPFFMSFLMAIFVYVSPSYAQSQPHDNMPSLLAHVQPIYLASLDSDHDGIPNSEDNDDDNDGIEDSQDEDHDGDGFTDVVEIAAGSDPDDEDSFPDIIPPVISAPANITVEATAVLTPVSLGVASATDNIDGTISVTNNAPATFPLGVTTIIYSATDVAGNTATATQIVTVIDTTAPVLTVPANVTTEATSAQTSVVLGAATATDIFGVTVVNDAPATFPVGVTTVTYTATDGNGLTSSGIQTVTITDTTAPVITVPANVSIEANAVLSTVSIGVATASDLVDGVVAVTNNAPVTFPLGVTTITFTASDAAGNTATATQLVTVVDTTAPVLTVPANITTEATSAQTSVVLGNATATDIFGATVTNDAPATFPVGVTTVTYTATDGNGLTSTGTQTVTVTDTTPPAIVTPANISVEANAVLSTVSIGVATASDLVDGVVTVTNNAPSTFPLGATTVTYTATDAVGNTATATLLVMVVDTTAPVLTVPANVTTEATAAQTSVVLGAATATDIFGATVVNDAPATFPVGITTVTYTATDGNGLTSTGIQTVTITDTTAPVITVHANVAVEATAVLTPVILGVATATDLVDGTVTVSNDAPASFPVGITTVTYSATDAAGNTASVTQTVTVTDTTAPVLTLVGGANISIEAGSVYSDAGASASDLVDGDISALITTTGTVNNAILGVYTITYQVSDSAGNAAVSIVRTVSVVDTTAPVISAPVAVSANAPDLNPIVVSIGTATATDLFAVTITHDAPASFPIGVTTVTWTATDASGNSATATQAVTVILVDTTPPVVTAPAAITLEATAVLTPVSLGVANAVDNVDTNVVVTSDAPASFPVGATTVTYSAADAAGNIGTATQLVTITDTTVPVITAPAAVSVETTGTNPVPVNIGSATATDLFAVSITSDAPASFPVGTTTVTWTATDANGNAATATQVVTVVKVVSDTDGDGVINSLDAFPNDPAASVDSDGDGYPNSWNTGMSAANSTSTPPLSLDVFINNPLEWSDLDGDGIGDNSDVDRDGDGFNNDIELQVGTDPNDAASVPADLDGDGIPDAIDPDIDGDGILNAADAFPTDPYRSFILPNLRITTPQTLITVAASPVQITGTLDDPTASLTINGAVVAPDTAGTFQAAVSLVEGSNTIVARAVTVSGHEVTDSINVYMDQTPPHMTITTPTDGQVMRTASISVGGLVNDIVRGTISANQANVTVNGVIATVSNRSYEAQGVSLVLGDNVITVSGSDQVGNTGSATVTVRYEPTTGAVVSLMSGDTQSANIRTALAQPLQVRLVDAAGLPAALKDVVFRVVQGDGKMGNTPNTCSGQAMIAKTDAFGVASGYFVLGSRAGNGNHRVRATAVGFDGEVIFTASALPNPGNKLSVNSGNNQRGAAGMALGLPFVAVVTDDGGNVVANTAVDFNVVAGGGQFDNGLTTYSTVTDSDGRASARFRLGFEPGLDNHRATASLVGTVYKAGFTASALVAGNPGQTSISGIVLDNQDNPLEGVTLRIQGLQRTAVTDVYGSFTITQAPVGPVHLIAEGATTTAAGEWPTLSQNIITVAGANNTLVAPIYMVKLDTANAVTVGATDVDYTVPSIPGFKLSVKAGSVTFPDGSKTGQLSVTAVNASKVPMAPPNGMQPQLIVTIQPVGAKFDPPAPLTLPNVDAHAPGAEVEMYSFDHDLEEFVAIGLGTVSADGSVIESNPGVGVVKAGWHCGSQPAGDGDVEGCPKFATHIVKANGTSGTLYIDKVPAVVQLDAIAQLVNNAIGCSAISYDWYSFGYNDVVLPTANTQVTLTQDGVYKFRSVVTADCGCTVKPVIKDIDIVVGKLNSTSSTDGYSAAANSFIVDSTLSGSINVAVPVTVGPKEQVKWEVVALKGNMATDDLPGEFSNKTNKPFAYGHVKIKTSKIKKIKGTGAFNDPYTLYTPEGINTIAFDPVPPPHYAATYTSGGDDPYSFYGTKLIDVYRHNPRLGYRITGHLLRGGEWIPFKSKIIQMDEIDMIRQEYVTHIASTSGTGFTVPTRAQVVLESSLGAGGWGSYNTSGVEDASYPYKHVLSNGMEKLWTDFSASFDVYAQTDVPLIDYYSQWRPAAGSGLTDPYAAYPTKKKLATNQTARVNSAFRNPERNERIGSTATSVHMLGRALDISVNNIGDSGTQSRGMAFYIAWKSIHGANPGDTGYKNVSYPAGKFPNGKQSQHVPWANYWQLEGVNGAADVVLKSHREWVLDKNGSPTGYDLDNNEDGILDGYGKTFHLHIEDRPNQGAHK